MSVFSKLNQFAWNNIRQLEDWEEVDRNHHDVLLEMMGITSHKAIQSESLFNKTTFKNPGNAITYNPPSNPEAPDTLSETAPIRFTRELCCLNAEEDLSQYTWGSLLSDEQAMNWIYDEFCAIKGYIPPESEEDDETPCKDISDRSKNCILWEECQSWRGGGDEAYKQHLINVMTILFENGYIEVVPV